MKIDLDLASNMFGRLGEDVRARLLAAIDRPGEDTWNDAYSIILNRDTGLGLTLWQAVCELDPSYTHTGPRSRWVEDDSELGGHSVPVHGWVKVPGPELITQAINYATR